MRKLLLILACSLPGWTESARLTLNHQPFPGQVQVLEGKIWVEIAPLARAMGWVRHPAYSGWCYARQAEGEVCLVKDLIGKGQTFLEGERVPTRVEEGRTLVPLEDCIRLFQLNPDRAATSIDLSPPGSQAYNPTLPLSPPLGQTVSLAGKLQPGKTHVAVFYTQWCPACWRYFPVLEELQRSHPEVELIEMDIDQFGSPMCKQFSIRATPWVRLFNDEGQEIADNKAAEAWLREKYGATMPTPFKCVGAPGR